VTSRAPLAEGRTVDKMVKPSLVHELVAWFENEGADTAIRPVVVRPPAEAGVR
jgi:hypothetical protein